MKRVISITILWTLFVDFSLFGQGNNIRGLGFPLTPLVNFTYGELTIGYEKYLDRKKSIIFTLNSWGYSYRSKQEQIIDAGKYSSLAFVNLIVDLRQYIINDRKFLNNFYGGSYLIASLNDVQSGGGCKNFVEGTQYTGKEFGFGLTVGKKLYLTDRLNIDIGAGVAGTYVIYSNHTVGPVCSETEKAAAFKLLPRSILTFGLDLGFRKKEPNEEES